MRRLHDEESGFTLVELLVASMVGTIILMSAFALVETAFRGQRTVENRLDAASNGRNAMEQVTRQLRSQVCLGKGIAPVVRAEANLVEFYASVAPPPTAPSDRHTIQRRTLEYVPDGSTGRGSIRQTVVDGTGTLPDLDFSGTPRQHTIARDVAPVAGKPFFRYYKYDPASAPSVLEVPAPVTALADRQVIVQVQTAFRAYPVHSQDATKVSTVLENKITVRTADPTDPTRSPQCI